MSILPAIAVYAAISRELGLPLRFPRKPGAYNSVYQVTESTHFANAALWAATDQRCGNEAFNITNGDYFRWRNLWPKIAAVFEIAVADPQTICLTQHMADKAALWEEMTAKYRLIVHVFQWKGCGLSERQNARLNVSWVQLKTQHVLCLVALPYLDVGGCQIDPGSARQPVRATAGLPERLAPRLRREKA
jgi:hypothetical protein